MNTGTCFGDEFDPVWPGKPFDGRSLHLMRRGIFTMHPHTSPRQGQYQHTFVTLWPEMVPFLRVGLSGIDLLVARDGFVHPFDSRKTNLPRNQNAWCREALAVLASEMEWWRLLDPEYGAADAAGRVDRDAAIIETNADTVYFKVMAPLLHKFNFNSQEYFK